MGASISTAPEVTFLKNHGVKEPAKVFEIIKSDRTLYTRLERVMNGDRVIEVDKESFFDDCFQKFTDRVPEWNDERCTIFWNSYDNDWRKKVLIIREQSAGLCFLSAVFVFEHYLTAIFSKGAIPTTYDVGKYEAKELRGEVLEDFLLNGRLSSTLGILKSVCALGDDDFETILLPSNRDLRARQYQDDCELISQLVASRPGIISQMKASHISGSSVEQIQFTDAPGNQLDSPRHAVLLIGACKKADGEYYFLVQNWWPSRPFLELSGRYLAHCDAKITFLLPTVTKLERREENEMILNNALYAETCSDIGEICLE